jgi:glutaconate CoA-transferase, subunit A
MSKQVSMDDLIAQIAANKTVGFGGGGVQRKPMAVIQAMARTNLENLDVISFLGGPDVDVLAGLGKIRRLHFAFVGFDAYGLAPNFRKARESGALTVVEYSEGSMLAAFEAAAKRLPFLPTRFGLGTDIITTSTSPFKMFPCPISGETLVAVPALSPDIAVIHVNEADRSGNAFIHGDAYLDPLLLRASKKRFVTAERVVDSLSRDHSHRSTFISRLWVDGVVEAPKGAGLTANFPDYPVDLPRLLEYLKRASDRAWLTSFVAEAA